MSHEHSKLLIHGESASLQFAEDDAELIAEYERLAETYSRPFTVWREFELALGSTEIINKHLKLLRDDEAPAPRKELSATERRWKRNRKQRSRR